MKISIQAEEIAELAKLTSENLKLDNMSFSKGNQINFTASFDISKNDTFSSKIFSKANKLTGRKKISLQISSSTPDTIDIKLKKAGLNYLGPINLILPLIIKKIIIPLILKFSKIEEETPDWLDFKSKSLLQINLSKALKATNVSIVINEIKLLNNNCYLEFSVNKKLLKE